MKYQLIWLSLLPILYSLSCQAYYDDPYQTQHQTQQPNFALGTVQITRPPNAYENFNSAGYGGGALLLGLSGILRAQQSWKAAKALKAAQSARAAQSKTNH